MIRKIIACIFIALAADAGTSGDDLETSLRPFMNYSLDDSRAVAVSDIDISLTYGAVRLNGGRLFLTGFFEGHPTAAFFVGNGVFSFNPPGMVERQQIQRFYETDSVLVEFDRAFFAFTINSKLFDSLDSGRNSGPDYYDKLVFRRLKGMPTDRFKVNFPFHILRACREGRDKFLWLNILKDRFHHTIYFYNPYAREQVGLYRLAPNFSDPQIVSLSEDTLFAEAPGYNIPAYEIDVDVSTYGKSVIDCRIKLEPAADSQKYVIFNLPEEYTIDSVWGDVAGSGAFVKERGRRELAVELDRYYSRGSGVSLGFRYRVNLFHQYIEYGVVPDNLVNWYPYGHTRQLSDYDLEYVIDDGFDFISVGRKIGDTLIDSRRHLHFQSDRRLAYVSFNYGLFDSVVVSQRNIPITIYSLQRRHNSVIFGNPNIKRVVGDVSGAFDFYREHIGPYGYDRLDAAAMSVGYGQGSPGLIHLAEATFQRSVPGIDDRFRAHEVAHQWWGHTVHPQGYRDLWLSEGMAEYSAALYIKLAKKDDKSFRAILKYWKDKIIQQGLSKGDKSVGFRAGSILLGSRLRGELSPGDYEVLVYYKAAYLLHMLRFELEEVAGREGAFFDLLAEFARTYADQLTTSADFIALAGQYLGDRTDAFFEQWLVDWRVPRIEKESRIGDDGSVRITAVVGEVGDDFRSPYPIEYHLSDGRVETVIYTIGRGENRFSYRSARGTVVTSVEFNPDLDILEQ